MTELETIAAQALAEAKRHYDAQPTAENREMVRLCRDVLILACEVSMRDAQQGAA